MTDPGVLVLTGGSGTVGSCLLDHLAATWPGRLCAVGRARPARLPAAHDFIACDLTDRAATAATAARLEHEPPISGLICIAGVDCRTGLEEITGAAFAASMQVNCLAHIQLLRATTR